ncbi:hypothetical protein [Megamonas funiformis]|uniref:hypothetical protein n=1 Tax=Megamonas funiformis TaxID=437897 RepID=UPI003F87F6D0
MINNKDLKEVIMLIAYREGLSQGDILDKYNAAYNKNLTKQSFSRSLKENSLKYEMVFDILDAIGYTIEIKKKI